MDDKLDKMLKHALTPTDEPDFWLNQNILNQAKEREAMEKGTGKKMRRIPAAALAAALVVGCGSVTAFAAWKYLTPQTVAEEFGETKIAEAFTNGDAVMVNETQSYGGYDVTLMGLASGKELSVYSHFDDNGCKLELDKTYSVVAIRKSDHTPMPDTSDDAYSDYSFFVSPLIEGYNPGLYNAFTMNGGYQEFSEQGVIYRIAECDNVEMFADHKLYLCVSEGSFYDNGAYLFDEATGEIKRNEDYSGLNALFDLPIDPKKADPETAKAYMENLWKDDEEQEDTGKKEDAKHKEDATDRWIDRLTAENIDQHATRIEESVQVCTPDSQGYISYHYTEKGEMEFQGKLSVKDIFSGEQRFMVVGCSGSEDDLEGLRIETVALNDDGTVTYAVYAPKQTESIDDIRFVPDEEKNK